MCGLSSRFLVICCCYDRNLVLGGRKVGFWGVVGSGVGGGVSCGFGLVYRVLDGY